VGLDGSDAVVSLAPPIVLVDSCCEPKTPSSFSESLSIAPRLPQEVGVKYSVLLWPTNQPTAHIGMVEDQSSDAHPSAFLSATQVPYQAEWSHRDVPA